SFAPDADRPEVLRMALRQKRPAPYPRCIATSSDGRVVGVALSREAQIWQRGQSEPLHLAHEDVRAITVSPDGKWVATGSHGTSLETRIWDAQSGRLVKRLPTGPFNYVAFSPDGQWLATTGGGVRLWKTVSWQESARIGGSVFAFSRDSKILAVEN